MRRTQRYLRGLHAAEYLVAAEAGRHRFGLAAAPAELAGRFASQRHPGRYVSLSLEGSLAAAGRSLPVGSGTSGAAGGVAADDKPSVLHVTTRNIELGGHTRWIQRAIEADAGRRHSLVVTAGGGA